VEHGRSRQPDLDVVRVACILLLHLYHSARMFNVNDPWHVKAPQLLPALNPPMDVLHFLRMPLLMLIAGMATLFSLRNRSLGAFALERTKRLLIPLLFGMAVIVPPQIWVERVWKGQTADGYLAFYASLFQGGWRPSWHHLWFVAYLLAFSLAALPLFALLRTRSGQDGLRRLEAFLARGANLWLLAIPVMYGRFLLRTHRETHDLWNDPKNLVFYGGLFLIGHLVARMPSVRERITALRHWHLAIAVVLLTLLEIGTKLPLYPRLTAIYAFIWASLCAALGYGRSAITRTLPLVDRAQSLAYPFYIFHQTVIVVLGWSMLRLSLGPWSFFASLTILSFLATWALCEIVARVPWMRPLFGLGSRKRA